MSLWLGLRIERVNNYMTNKEASEKIFTYLRDNHFEPININYKNSYFVFDMGENSVVSFSIKGLHNWQFGMWVDTNENNNGDEKTPVVQFFCQHTLNIDKFKPSRSFFLQEFELSEVKSNNPWLYPLLPMLKTIKNHPFVSFAMDGYGGQYYEGSYFLYYLRERAYNIQEFIKNWWKNFSTKLWHGSKIWFLKRYNIVNNVILYDYGTNTSPRYEMRIHFNKISNDIYEQEDVEIKMLDKWFTKNYYSNMSLALTREGRDGRYLYRLSKD